VSYRSSKARTILVAMPSDWLNGR